MANRNKTAGNNYERQIMNELIKMGYDVKTARNESRTMDAKGVDIVGNFPFHAQCKLTCNIPNYHKLITTMPDDKPGIIFHGKVEKANTQFVKKGEYVTMEKETFYDLMHKWNNMEQSK